MNIKVRLIVMNFLQFAVWGAYLTSMGTYLARVGLGNYIGLFYAMQGIVSLFMLGYIRHYCRPLDTGSAFVRSQSFIGGVVYGGCGVLRTDGGQ